jgi:hypothetical protein
MMTWIERIAWMIIIVVFWNEGYKKGRGDKNERNE